MTSIYRLCSPSLKCRPHKVEMWLLDFSPVPTRASDAVKAVQAARRLCCLRGMIGREGSAGAVQDAGICVIRFARERDPGR